MNFALVGLVAGGLGGKWWFRRSNLVAAGFLGYGFHRLAAVSASLYPPRLIKFLGSPILEYRSKKAGKTF